MKKSAKFENCSMGLRGRNLSKVCSVGKSSGVPLPIQGGVSVNPSLGTIWNKLLLLPSAISTCWASGLPSAGGNSSLGPNFRKLFPYEYRLKCKYIHPCPEHHQIHHAKLDCMLIKKPKKPLTLILDCEKPTE